MKRHNVAALLVVVGMVIIVGLSYGTRSGRRAVRQVSGAVRLVRNTTQIYPPPILLLRIRVRSDSAEARLEVKVFQSGRFVASGQESVDRTLSAETTEKLFELGKAALGDFSSDGCDVASGTRSADLYLLIDGAWIGSVCRRSSKWPQGAETRRLLDQISRQLPDSTKRLDVF